MKPLTTYLAASTIALSGSLFLGGCYTQFALDDTDEEDAAYEQPSYVDQPPVWPILYGAPGPIFIPVPVDPPGPGAAGPANGTGGAVNQPKRESGKQRVPPATGRPVGPPPRSGGTTAPAPAPAAPVAPAPVPVTAAPVSATPAPAAPVRGSESRSSGGSGSRR
jgi:hypothetical protein